MGWVVRIVLSVVGVAAYWMWIGLQAASAAPDHAAEVYLRSGCMTLQVCMPDEAKSRIAAITHLLY